MLCSPQHWGAGGPSPLPSLAPLPPTPLHSLGVWDLYVPGGVSPMDLTVQALIIGGGATGSAIARDLALRGVSTCLLERGDLASGTTGHYHGLLHSGARYVTNDPATARECAEEGAILRRIAPHCIEETGGLFLILDGRAELLFQKPFVEGCRAAGIPT